MINFLYIGYWNLNDPLTTATIFPGLRFLRQLYPKGSIVFVNIQREQLASTINYIFAELQIKYVPISSGNGIIHKFRDFWFAPPMLENLCVEHQISKVIARGAPAGALAYLLWKRNRVPFLVESFEPHADYMRYSGTWHKFDLRYLLQKHWEEKQKRHAQFLLVVSENYRLELLKEGIENGKIKVAPCGCDPLKFYPNQKLRSQTRIKLGISEKASVGIYAGKFGGLYEEHKAFRVFKKFFSVVPDFYLILLSSASKSWVQEILRKYEIPTERVIHVFVPHQEVNSYLNAADFGFAMYKSNPVSSYLSPVKIGEYWASGLPVVIEENIGDESDFVEKQQLGMVIKMPFFFEDPSVVIKIGDLMRLDKFTISQKGLSIRSFEKTYKIYKQVLS